jgi:hypothetical protein
VVSSPSLIPLPFSGDEQVALDGVDRPLLPPRTVCSPEQAPWSPAMHSPAYWSGVDFDTQHRLPTQIGLASHGHGLWASVSTGAATPLAAYICSLDCKVHTEAYHDALVLLDRRNQLPAQFVHGWQSNRTDEIMSWFSQQENMPSSPSPSPSPVRADGQLHLDQPALPTRQDGEMLRVCQWFPDPHRY